MARKRRREVIDESNVGAYHIWTRAARRTFLFGFDPQTGRDFSHRKELLARRVADLASIYAIDVCDQTVLDNHLHLILRNRPDIVAQWSDEEVARRWLRLNMARLALEDPPTDEAVATFLADAKQVAAARKALSSISSFMQYLKCSAAVVFNIEDRCTGHFWQGRFSCERLRDDASLLVCSLYVNLNPIRAGVAQRLERSEYTSVAARLADAKTRDKLRRKSGHFASVHVDGDGYDGVKAGRRASNKGYLWLSLAEYVELAEAMVRREKAERAGGELLEYPSVLKRLGIDRVQWENAVRLTSSRFARELDNMAAMKEEARRRK